MEKPNRSEQKFSDTLSYCRYPIIEKMLKKIYT